MEIRNRRIIDHDHDDWSETDRNAGIANRLKFAVPGSKINLRRPDDSGSPDTLSLYYDSVREITWEHVMDILIDEGVFEVDSGYVKRVVGFGDHGNTLDYLVNRDDEKFLSKFDIKNRRQRQEFIHIILKREILKSGIVKYGTFDLNDLLISLTVAAMEVIDWNVDYGIETFCKFEEATDRFLIEFLKVFKLNGINFVCEPPLVFIVFDGKKQSLENKTMLLDLVNALVKRLREHTSVNK